MCPVFPVFIQRPEDVDQLVWNDRCHANLTVYLKRPEIRALGRPAIVVKGCDQRALVVLEKESQLDRSQVYVIGMACDGMGRPKCETCDVHEPRGADVVIGQAAGNADHDIGRSTLRGDQRLPGPVALGAAGLLAAGTGPLREVLRLPAGLPDVLLPALHRR